MFLRWVDGKAQVADALTKLHGDGDLLRAVCRQAFTALVEADMNPCSHHVVLPRYPAIGSRTSLRDPCCLFAFVRIVAELRCSLGSGTTAVSGDS